MEHFPPLYPYFLKKPARRTPLRPIETNANTLRQKGIFKYRKRCSQTRKRTATKKVGFPPGYGHFSFIEGAESFTLEVDCLKSKKNQKQLLFFLEEIMLHILKK